MSKLLDRFLEWAWQDKRWPLLFIMLLPPLFDIVRQYFEIPYRQVFTHACFLISSGALGVLGGVLYVSLASPKKSRLKSGGAITLAGALVLILGLVQLSPVHPGGDTLKVGIADFTPVGPDAENEARNFTHRIERKLHEKQSVGVPLKIVRLNTRISDPDGEAKAIALAKSHQVNSHVVIWGEIRKDETELYVHPRLTIASQFRRRTMAEQGMLPSVASGPTHLGLKKRLSTEIADIVLLVYGFAHYRSQSPAR